MKEREDLHCEISESFKEDDNSPELCIRLLCLAKTLYYSLNVLIRK